MKKKLAFSIAGATAAVIGGWKLVQQMVDRGDEPATSTPSPAPASPSAPPASATPAPAGSNSSKSKLYEIATGLNIKGRSKMSKEELLEAISRAEEGA